jgi:Carboxypeptidase regulatory-like domain
MSTRVVSMVAIALAGLLHACSGGGGSSPPPPGFLSGTVTAGTPAAPLAAVSITVFDANTNAPVNAAVQTSVTGTYSIPLNAGSYYLKMSKQGYTPVPPSALLTPVPMNVASGATTTNDVTMAASTVSGGGWIQGKVSYSTGAGIGGVLVAAETGNSAHTSITDSAGNYAIHNLPAVSYTVKAFVKDATFTAQAGAVTADQATTVDLTAAASPATGTVPVSFQMIAQTGVTSPATMRISLVHPITKEAIPGLSLSQTHASSLNYSFSGVPDGNYVVRASFANDTIVVDPDAIVKFGEPEVNVAGGTPTPNLVDIKATGAVALLSPSNAVASTVPVDVSLTATPIPTFSWNNYPSSSDYAIEVMDAASGAVIWGGFSGSGGTLTKNVIVAGTSVAFNADGSASAQLEAGKTYRWRVYASKDDNTATPNWSLISMSEDQRGLIRIVP